MRIAIIGTAPGSRMIAPYDDQSYEIWACSAGNSQASALPRVTKWFELHAIVDMTGAENKAWVLPYYKWLKEQNFITYMQEKNDYVPQAVVFPYKILTERFGPNPKKALTNWFTSTVAWMIAFAIVQMKEGDEIAIFGVDMAAMEEHYTAQKSGIQRMIEYARAEGITVKIPYESCLAAPYPLYGYSEATPMGRKLAVRLHEMLQIRGQIDNNCRQQEIQRAFFDGAIESCRYEIRTWTGGMDAELDTGDQPTEQYGLQMKDIADRKMPLTRDFQENDAGVFVPKSLMAQTLPEGSTVSIDENGKKHYGMVAEPGRMNSGEAESPPPEIKRKRGPNGKTIEAQ